MWFVQRVEAAKQRVLKARDLKNEVEERKDGVKDELRRANEGFLKVVAEVKALERQKSNLPARLVDLRERMARDLSIPEEKLPFVGELVEVRAEKRRGVVPSSVSWAVSRGPSSWTRSTTLQCRLT